MLERYWEGGWILWKLGGSLGGGLVIDYHSHAQGLVKLFLYGARRSLIARSFIELLKVIPKK